MDRRFKNSPTQSPQQGSAPSSNPMASNSMASNHVAGELTPALIYAVIAGASALLVAQRLSSSNSMAASLLVVLLVVTLTIRFWMVGLMLVVIQVSLLFMVPASWFASVHSQGSVFLTVAVLTLVMSTSRYLALTVSPMPYRVSGSWLHRVAMRHFRRAPCADFAAYGVLPRKVSTLTAMEVVTMLLRIVIAVAAVSVLLAMVPVYRDAPNFARLYPVVVRGIHIVVILLVIYVLTNGLLNVLVWRRLSSAESRMFLRSELSQWIHREVSAVARRRIKSRKSRRNRAS